MRPTLYSIWYLLSIAVVCLTTMAKEDVVAQPRVAYIQPDQAAPGMSVAVEILAPASANGAFGVDRMASPDLIEFTNPDDTNKIVVGIPIVSWNGRLIQVPFLVESTVIIGDQPVAIPLRVNLNGVRSNVDTFWIVRPHPSIQIHGDVQLGYGSEGTLSKRNTLVVQSLDLQGPAERGKINFNLSDPDSATPGNPRLKPVVILSVGPVRFTNVELQINGDSTSGGPGGGGGGHGYEGSGGAGFTGGGSAGELEFELNIGSGDSSNSAAGGSSISGVAGGESAPDDQGGGGGTGHPFGTSGRAGDGISDSPPGGFGGGSAGGESQTQGTAYGGGGAGHTTDGTSGEGVGRNQGKKVGGRFLLPLAGGSGGGAGNSVGNILRAGNGGGGGGGLSIVAFDSIVFRNSLVNATGANGSNGIANTGAGGGGAGGAINIASNTGLSLVTTRIDAAGGLGGNAGLNGGDGGDGARGLVRIDASTTPCADCEVLAEASSALTLQRDHVETVDGVAISGIAGAPTAMSGLIRIYYRNRHSAWQFVETNALVAGSQLVWSTTIPKLRDSILYVAAYQRLTSPDRSEYNAEPDWISTHVSSAILRVTPRPRIVTIDTLRFGTVKTGSCLPLPLGIGNQGQATLTVDDMTVGAPFSVVASPGAVSGYETESAIIEYCPKLARCDTTILTIANNDITRNIILIGCGEVRDERLSVSPPTLQFEPVYAGTCDTATIRFESIGADTATIDLTDLATLPFTLDTIGMKRRLAPGEVFLLRAVFCPLDSGEFIDSLLVFGETESIKLRGIGLRRIVVFSDTVLVDACFGIAETVIDSIVNNGNDVVRVTSLDLSDEITLVAPSLPWIIQPHSTLTIEWKLLPPGSGTSEYSIFYVDGTDTVGRTLVVANTTLRRLAISDIEIVTCASEADSTSLVVENIGSGDVVLTASVADPRVTISPLGPNTIAPGDRLTFTVGFLSSSSDDVNIPVSIRATSAFCPDTTYVVNLHAVSTSEPLVLSLDTLDFGQVRLDSCATLTTVINHGCGEPITISIDQLTIPGLQLVLPLAGSYTLNSGESIELVYEYCPKVIGELAETHALNAGTGTVDVVLLGSAVAENSGLFRARIDDAVVLTGESIDLALHLEGGSVPITRIDFVLSFDPAVLAFRKISKTQPGWNATPTQLAPGTIRITANGPQTTNSDLLDLRFMGLLGPRPNTQLVVREVAVNLSDPAQADSAFVQVIDCTGLSGSVLAAGSYALGIPWPQPASEGLHVWLRAGAAGPYKIKILTAAGQAVDLIEGLALQGESVLFIPIRELAPGAYFMILESLGFREARTFWVVR